MQHYQTRKVILAAWLVYEKKLQRARASIHQLKMWLFISYKNHQVKQFPTYVFACGDD